MTKLSPDKIKIRTGLQSGDIGGIILLHGIIYKEEYGYDHRFEAYVAEGIGEFALNYTEGKDNIWICEYMGEIVGCLILVNRGSSAQLRYYLIKKEFRGLGLGKKLMGSFMEFLKKAGYNSAYLWTTSELTDAAVMYKKFGFVLTEEKESNSWGKKVLEQKYEFNVGFS